MLEIWSKCIFLRSMTKQQWLKKTQMPCVFVSKPACHVMPASLSLSLLTRLQSQKKCQRRQESFQQYLHTFMHSFFLPQPSMYWQVTDGKVRYYFLDTLGLPPLADQQVTKFCWTAIIHHYDSKAISCWPASQSIWPWVLKRLNS